MADNLTRCWFVSDLHGKIDRYNKLFDRLSADPPDVLFVGGDILPNIFSSKKQRSESFDFIDDCLAVKFGRIREKLKESYPTIVLILGNDDGRACESAILKVASNGIWTYVHNRKVEYGEYSIYGYTTVPPTPFLLKDWEQYDISKDLNPGSIPPEAGFLSPGVSIDEKKHSTIQKDLERLTDNDDLSRSIMLFHSPPYNSNLDRVARGNVGSRAIRSLIETRQPLLTLHGHIHESSRLTGSWHDMIGETIMFSAAHDGPELALVTFDLENLNGAIRELI